MTVRWSTLLMDRADLDQLPRLSPADLATHADSVLEQRLPSRALFRRWEQQQWESERVSLDRDTEQWQDLPAVSQAALRRAFFSFFVGEYTGLDGLGAIMLGCPGEEDLVFLGTQVGDEARHTVMMSRIASDLVGLEGGLRQHLPAVWSELPESHHALQRVEDAMVLDVLGSPTDYAKWVRLVAVFHILTEGVLALHGLRNMVRSLRRIGQLPGVETAFIAMMRDEARHVSFGTHALRQAMQEGMSDAVVSALEEAIPHVLHIEDEPGRPNLRTTRALSRELDRRLDLLGLAPEAVEHLQVVAARPYPSH